MYVEWVRCSTRPPDPVPGKRPSLNGNENTGGRLLPTPTGSPIARRGR